MAIEQVFDTAMYVLLLTQVCDGLCAFAAHSGAVAYPASDGLDGLHGCVL